MSSFAAGLATVGIPAAFIAIIAIVMPRRQDAAGLRMPGSARVTLGWRLVGGFAPYFFLIGVICLYVWGRGAFGLERQTVSGSWFVLALGVVFIFGSVVGYANYLRRRRAARRDVL